MDKPVWLIEDISDNDITLLTKALKYTNTQYKIYDPHLDFNQGYSDSDCVITYGSIQFVNRIQRYTKWIPGSYYTVDNYYCSQYYQHFKPGHLLNCDFLFLPLWSIPEKKDYLFYKNNGRIFIRPDGGGKVFTGNIICQYKFDEDFKSLTYNKPSSNTMCLISSTKNIVEEYRLFVVDNKILGGSRYKPSTIRISRIHYNDVFLFGESALSGWEPDRAWCLDICRTDDGNLYVLEINAFSTSGLYNTDMTPIVEAINQVAINEYKEYM